MTPSRGFRRGITWATLAALLLFVLLWLWGIPGSLLTGGGALRQTFGRESKNIERAIAAISNGREGSVAGAGVPAAMPKTPPEPRAPTFNPVLLLGLRALLRRHTVEQAPPLLLLPAPDPPIVSSFTVARESVAFPVALPRSPMPVDASRPRAPPAAFASC